MGFTQSTSGAHHWITMMNVVCLGGHHGRFLVIAHLILRLTHEVLCPLESRMTETTVPQKELPLLSTDIVIIVVELLESGVFLI